VSTERENYIIIGAYKQGLLVSRCDRNGKELDPNNRFLACPVCFSTVRGGGVLAAGSCSNCGWAPPRPEPESTVPLLDPTILAGIQRALSR